MSVLRQLRLEKGYTQAEVAKRIGITVSAYNYLENAKRTADKEIAEKLSDLLNVEVDEIFLPKRFTPRELHSKTSA